MTDYSAKGYIEFPKGAGPRYAFMPVGELIRPWGRDDNSSVSFCRVLHLVRYPFASWRGIRM